jgi:hypothetical protein
VIKEIMKDKRMSQSRLYNESKNDIIFMEHNERNIKNEKRTGNLIK